MLRHLLNHTFLRSSHFELMNLWLNTVDEAKHNTLQESYLFGDFDALICEAFRIRERLAHEHGAYRRRGATSKIRGLDAVERVLVEREELEEQLHIGEHRVGDAEGNPLNSNQRAPEKREYGSQRDNQKKDNEKVRVFVPLLCIYVVCFCCTPGRWLLR